MPKVLPSHVVQAIDQMFGSGRNELDGSMIRDVHRAEVHTLLALLDGVPRELIDLGARDYLELSRCLAVLANALASWNAGGALPAGHVGGKDPIERLRRLLLQCHDQVPPPEPELRFITDVDVRLGIEDRLKAAWTDFGAREWLGATVMAAAALEALLLWALKQVPLAEPPKKPLDEIMLGDLIALAEAAGLIDQTAARQARLAKDARNLIHPGRALRSDQKCTKSTALAALAGAYCVADKLKATVV